MSTVGLSSTRHAVLKQTVSGAPLLARVDLGVSCLPGTCPPRAIEAGRAVGMPWHTFNAALCELQAQRARALTGP